MELPLGEGSIEVDLAPYDPDVAVPPGGDPVDVETAAREAVADPHGPGLDERVAPDDDVAIVVTDLTRSAPDDVLLDVLLDALAEAGVDRRQVTVVIGLGLHRPMDDDEIRDMLGEAADLAVNHDPDDTVEVGRVSAPGLGDDCAVELDHRVAAADSVLSTGVVEPHQYAGFSGGAKTVAVGAGGEPLIRYTHGPDVLSLDGVRLGRVADNPFRETVDRAGDLIGIDFCLNLLDAGTAGVGSPDDTADVAHDHPVLDVAAGDHRDVVADLAATGREALAVSVDGGYDAVVAGVGAPKDANLYQATRGATYVALGARNPLRSGDDGDGGGSGEGATAGRIVVPARLEEGAGQGTGERRFYERLRGADGAAALYEEMTAGYDPGAQRAFVVARVLRDHEVVITNSGHPEVVEECPMIARPSVTAALSTDDDVLVVPDALNTLLVED